MRGLPGFRSGQVVPVHPLGPALANARTETLIKAGDLQITRIILQAGERHAAYRSVGHVVIQCLEGRVKVTRQSNESGLSAGELLHVSPNEQHSMHAMLDSSLLVVCMNPLAQPATKVGPASLDAVDQASSDSFPASDPPSRTPVAGTGPLASRPASSSH